ncbi:UdgX family uracil-DNA binding protein [Hyphomicrobium sp.]|uniref:UdgX family uracil-DNA binding protein n=1 Tax=Hyphomicrobium sp. TaxID=82 RepID=UPI0025C0535B|nr:UdgX family uracil-DNA binding protein [Hyphomicrobium sp.]MCC7254141.1 UdgX family uracil-DNA binding protein [Hyphomicrobium sp.]
MVTVAVTLKPGADLDGFRKAVRALIARDVAPEHVVWQSEAALSLFGEAMADESAPVALSRAACELIGHVVCHRDAERYGLLYTLVWRMTHGEPALLDVASDPLVFRLAMMEKAVRRDLHKMHAFLRFRRVEGSDGERYVAWFEPDHFILEATADFFVDRFRSLTWSILTPVGSLLWDGETLTVGPPARREDAPPSDDFEAGWASYYASTFNPARTNVAQMQKEMPKKYWRNMPETKLIPYLLRSAGSRVETIMKKAPDTPRRKAPTEAVLAIEDAPKTLAELNAIITAAEPFVHGGKRAVLGEGPLRPAIAFVGEQPGDQEDIEGRPFVGPAGQLLTRAMAEAGIERDACYVTNAVKHFKFEQRGKRRLHQKPTTGEVRHYRWWLMKELELVQPALVVALGATAVLALAGKALPITKCRGPARFGAWPGFITVHPSYLLRLPDAAAKRAAYTAFVADLAKARTLARKAIEAAA